MIRPGFQGERLCGGRPTIAHHVDVGGIVPGSNSLSAVEIHQEGSAPAVPEACRIAGQIDDTLLQVIAANVRGARSGIRGHSRADVGRPLWRVIGLRRVLDRYGPQAVARYGDALRIITERMARAGHRRASRWPVPSSRTISTAWARHPHPIELHVLADRARRRVTDVLDRDAAQVKGGINAPLSFCKSNVYAALRSVMPAEMPNCHGYTRRSM